MRRSPAIRDLALSRPAGSVRRASARISIAAAAAFMLLTPIEAAAGIRTTRTASRAYDSASVEPPTDQGEAAADYLCVSHDVGCVTFLARPRETYVRIRIRDGSGTPVYGLLDVDFDGDGPIGGYRMAFCGRSRRISIPGGATLTVSVRNAIVVRPVFFIPLIPDLACPGVATSGTVRATFFRWVG